MTPDDVIKFWFGDELEKGTAAMETDEYKDKMNIRWFRRSDDFDNEIRSKGFPELIRKASAGALGPEWDGAK
eukprot:CAMPEP_0177689868 /NCGR_PEP_ID=MMETSP0484_2-20121128/439_1 /TAXON_ID=354590 /ORGANISM="Rhodomonas lens, Strain RHODO" /LENGTH=71 /DNA_ID=CAMNT_0019200327 /DNA_START=31 /DNA_END=243 /DNA_ORIENTATION=+